MLLLLHSVPCLRCRNSKVFVAVECRTEEVAKKKFLAAQGVREDPSTCCALMCVSVRIAILLGGKLRASCHRADQDCGLSTARGGSTTGGGSQCPGSRST